jgi:hypothetical protein
VSQQPSGDRLSNIASPIHSSAQSWNWSKALEQEMALGQAGNLAEVQTKAGFVTLSEI